MAEGPWSRLKGQRTKVLRLARDLARSGQHQSHRSIVEELTVEAFAEAHRCLTNRAISAQLDRLCAVALAPAGAPSLAAYIAETRQAARTRPEGKC